MSGKRAEAFKVINTMKAQDQSSYGSPFGIAAIYCGLAEKEQALAWLEKAYQGRDEYLVYLNVYPEFQNLHSDKRFQALQRQIGLLQ